MIVGEGPCRAALAALAGELGVAACVTFAGHRSTEELLPFYAFASAFVLPSLREPWGLVVNEAMASALPVIVSRICGAADDVVLDGENGFRFESSVGRRVDTPDVAAVATRQRGTARDGAALARDHRGVCAQPVGVRGCAHCRGLIPPFWRHRWQADSAAVARGAAASRCEVWRHCHQCAAGVDRRCCGRVASQRDCGILPPGRVTGAGRRRRRRVSARALEVADDAGPPAEVSPDAGLGRRVSHPRPVAGTLFDDGVIRHPPSQAVRGVGAWDVGCMGARQQGIEEAAVRSLGRAAPFGARDVPAGTDAAPSATTTGALVCEIRWR